MIYLSIKTNSLKLSKYWIIVHESFNFWTMWFYNKTIGVCSFLSVKYIFIDPGKYDHFRLGNQS